MNTTLITGQRAAQTMSIATAGPKIIYPQQATYRNARVRSRGAKFTLAIIHHKRTSFAT
jgi:hypothetical protein